MDHGGILYLFPPTKNLRGEKGNGRARTEVLHRDRLEALDPRDLNLSASEHAEFLHSRLVFRAKRSRREAEARARTRQAPNGGSRGRRTVVPKETRKEQKVNQDRQEIAAN